MATTNGADASQAPQPSEFELRRSALVGEIGEVSLKSIFLLIF
jgi:hypothetical protein